MKKGRLNSNWSKNDELWKYNMMRNNFTNTIWYDITYNTDNVVWWNMTWDMWYVKLDYNGRKESNDEYLEIAKRYDEPQRKAPPSRTKNSPPVLFCKSLLKLWGNPPAWGGQQSWKSLSVPESFYWPHRRSFLHSPTVSSPRMNSISNSWDSNLWETLSFLKRTKIDRWSKPDSNLGNKESCIGWCWQISHLGYCHKSLLYWSFCYFQKRLFWECSRGLNDPEFWRGVDQKAELKVEEIDE